MDSSAPDLTFFVWIGIICAGLVFGVLASVLGWHKHKKLRHLRRAFRFLAKPDQIDAEVRKAEYAVLELSNAVQIISSWFTHDDTESLQGAPTRVLGRLLKTMNLNRGSGEITLTIFYDLPFVLKDFSINLAQATAQLVLDIRETGKGQIEITYKWSGADLAITDMFSIDYKVLHYLIDRTEKEFVQRGYKCISDEKAKGDVEKKMLLRAGQSKQWWRKYSGTGGRTYEFWPNPQDYLESVQNPQQNFKDAGLQVCSPTLTELGIPRVASGMFASVYQMKGENEQWALRCFDTRLIDQQERYKAISSFILADDLSYTVDFHYLEDGIKCNGTWFPVLKMTWVEGIPLDAYVRENLKNFQIMQKLRRDFQHMMERLRANSVAHGDLQHGNILVSSSELFLVDYDGFYVPELAGRHSNELGHPNYQHPTRTERVFGPHMDNFSAWVIDLSLLCLIEDPSLWHKFLGGDECLIFRKADFVHPDASKLVVALSNHENQRIRSAVQKLLELLKVSIDEIPYLESDKTELSLPESLDTQIKSGAEI